MSRKSDDLRHRYEAIENEYAPRALASANAAEERLTRLEDRDRRRADRGDRED
jgi:hypothetical protein